jgi:hypothetical protein
MCRPSLIAVLYPTCLKYRREKIAKAITYVRNSVQNTEMSIVVEIKKNLPVRVHARARVFDDAEMQTESRPNGRADQTTFPYRLVKSICILH